MLEAGMDQEPKSPAFGSKGRPMVCLYLLSEDLGGQYEMQ